MDVKESLLRKVSRNSAVVGHLKGSEAWQFVIEDMTEAKQRIDDAWAFVTDKDKLQELRVSKLALIQVIHLLENYEHDLNMATKQLSEVDDPEVFAKANYGEKS